jgi:hypothetical protein
MGKRDKLSFYSLRPQNVTHATGKITASSFCMFVQLTCKRLSSARANWQNYSNLLLHVCATDMQKVILSKSKLRVLKYRAGNPNSSSYYICNGNGKAIIEHTPLRVQDYNRQQFEMKTTVLLH